jgi:ABC-type Na+ efflux pump permease subunit
MNKTLIIAKREYRAAVRTKAFLVSLILLPVFMGGGMMVFTLLKDKVDLTDKNVAVIDYTGQLGKHLIMTAEDWKNKGAFNEQGEKISPVYYFQKSLLFTIFS